MHFWKKYPDLIFLAIIVLNTSLLTEYTMEIGNLFWNNIFYYTNVVSSIILGIDVVIRVIIGYRNWIKKG